MFRRIATLLLLAAALPLQAQQPPLLEPLPEPPPGLEPDQTGERPVRIQRGTGEQVEETTVINGQRMVRVTTPDGAVYYLIEDLADGPGLRNESLDSRIRVPAWVIRQF